MTQRLLVIDDDPVSCRLIQGIFVSEGCEVASAHDARSGASLASAEAFDLVILDLHLPDRNGIEILEWLRQEDARRPVIMLTGNVETRTAVRAMRLGAFDYLTKPIDPEELVVVVRRALETRALQSEVAELRQRLGEAGGLLEQMGPSPAVAAIRDQVRTVAATSFSVLILGETGTGKELVAQAIHRESDRRAKAFIAVDCGAIPETLIESELFGHEKGAFTGAERRREGRFALADGGTVFLDEIGNLALGLQAKLLRVLESKQLQSVGSTKSTPMDVRFLAATNDDLQSRVGAGKFRPDLYFRLAQYTISLPRLSSRKADISYLARRFSEEVGVELRRPIQEIAPDAMALLEAHPWPGNVRELRNVIRQAVLEAHDMVLRAPQLRKQLGSPSAARGDPVGTLAGRSLREIAEAAAREAEHLAICEALRRTQGNKSQAAKMLSTDYKTLHVKVKALGIRARDFEA